MKIKFKQDVELQIVVDFDQATDEPTYETSTFLQNDEADIDICDAENPPLAREIQFGDGSVAFVTPEFWAVVEVL